MHFIATPPVCTVIFTTKRHLAKQIDIMVKHYGGYYNRNPFYSDNSIYYNIAFGSVEDMDSFCKEKQRLETDIVEKDSRPGFFTKIFRNFTYRFRNYRG